MNDQEALVTMSDLHTQEYKRAERFKRKLRKVEQNLANAREERDAALRRERKLIQRIEKALALYREGYGKRDMIETLTGAADEET